MSDASSIAPPNDALAVAVAAARRRLVGVAHRTPVLTSRTLDARLGCHVFFKAENLQRAGAFKFRGAWNAIACLPEPVRARGVVASSSGNHAQAVALVAALHGIPAAVAMPSDAPSTKLAATRAYGAEILHHDRAGEERDAMAARIAGERGLTLVPPFDHPDIVAGQGSAAAELFEDVGGLDWLLVPVGGGGLIAGSSIAAHMLCPTCRVVGVEPEAGGDGTRSFTSGGLVRQPCGATIADGARTPSLGTFTFAIIRRNVAQMVTVPDTALIEAMSFVWQRMKIIVEPTGVLGLAALMSGTPAASGERVGVILSGGNVDPHSAALWLG